jgi:hypothetical protein
VSAQDVVQRIWYGDDKLAAASRLVLLPAERLFGGVVGLRDILYDVGWLPTQEAAIPVVSIGNLTVGGTGKTPIAAWVASGLAARGAQPAVVLRGYGEDEPLVHERLNPSIPVIVNPDRTRAVAMPPRGALRSRCSMMPSSIARFDATPISSSSAPTGGRPTCACCRPVHGASRSRHCGALRW